MDTQEAAVFRCELCSKDFKNENGLNGHNRIKHPPEVDIEPDIEPEIEEVPAKAGLKPYPYRGMGVNENAALRTVKMVVPNCPVDDNPDSPNFTGETNCQAGKYRAGWWDECIAKGHNPYFTVKEHVQTKNIVDPATGLVTGQEQRVIRKESLNVQPVALSIRHSTNQGMMHAESRGWKRLRSLGYEEVCFMRACESPAKVRTRYGEFCNERHARLVQANEESVFLVVGGAGTNWEREREQQLSAVSLND